MQISKYNLIKTKINNENLYFNGKCLQNLQIDAKTTLKFKKMPKKVSQNFAEFAIFGCRICNFSSQNWHFFLAEFSGD
jgi:hypothetical protein